MYYTNPRMEAEIEDWPFGQWRTKAIFRIETHPKRGQRGTRITLHPIDGQPSAPKLLTYAKQARIVDGSDGRTYIAELSHLGGHISIMAGDMKYEKEILYKKDQGYQDVLMALFGETV